MNQKKTNYQKLWKRKVLENLQLHKDKTTLVARLTETTKILVVLKDMVEEFVPKKRHEAFKKELDRKVKNFELNPEKSN